MKNIIGFILIVLTLCFFTSCGCDNSVKNSNNATGTSSTDSNSKNKDTLNNSTQESSTSKQLQSSPNSEITQSSKSVSEVVSAYQSPAKVLDIDLSKDDPSNDDIRFEYDEKDRISKCYYKVNNDEIYQSYTYTDDTVHIYAFNGSVIVDDVTFDYNNYDENLGFSEYNGYYFSNVDVGKTDNNENLSSKTITEEEAKEIVKNIMGEDFGRVYEGIIEKDNEKYYAIRIRKVFDGWSSSWGVIFVRLDGLKVIEGEYLNGVATFGNVIKED